MINKKYYYSNCLFEAIKHKILHPFKIKIKYLSPKSNCGCPHWMWVDDKYIYDFYNDKFDIHSHIY